MSIGEMTMSDLLNVFHEVASNPMEMKNTYLKAGRKVVLVNYYAPEEIVHSMGFVPMAAWGADVEIKEAKQYFPAFICSVMQTLLELGMNGTYEGVSAIIIPSLCDSLKVTGQNWKYAVPSIPFIPMTYPQNRKPAYGAEFVKAGYKRVIADLEAATGATFSDEALRVSLDVYNAHNKVMRELSEVLAQHPEITVSQRSDIFKSAGFMPKEEHTELVRALIEKLKQQTPGAKKLRIVTSGILADSPSLLSILEENGYQIVWDDVAAESRQYRSDAPEAETALDSLAQKYCGMDNDTLLYDADKSRVRMIVEQAKAHQADGVVVIMTKFCDPEEFDSPLIYKACQTENLPMIEVEVDRQMNNYEQARTLLESFREIIE